jgi:hypothetical protein
MEIFLLIQGPVLKNKSAFRVDRSGRSPMRRIGQKILQTKPALFGERKQPAHQFEKPRFPPDIQQFKEFRAGILPQSRQKPFGCIDRIVPGRAIRFKKDQFRSHFHPRVAMDYGSPSPSARLPHHRDSSVIGSSQCGGDIAAIDGGHIRGGLERQRLGQKCLRHIVGRHFPAKQVPLHVVLFAETARAGA